MFSSVIVCFLCVAWFSVPLLGTTPRVCPDDYQSELRNYTDTFQNIASLQDDSLTEDLCSEAKSVMLRAIDLQIVCFDLDSTVFKKLADKVQQVIYHGKDVSARCQQSSTSE